MFGEETALACAETVDEVRCYFEWLHGVWVQVPLSRWLSILRDDSIDCELTEHLMIEQQSEAFAAPRPTRSKADSPIPTELARVLVARAEAIASVAHHAQTDANGERLVNDAVRVAARFDPETEPVEHGAAWLHDVIENTTLTATDLLQAGVPTQVVEVVALLTHRPGGQDAEYFERIRGNSRALRVKAASLDDNAAAWRSRLLDEPTRARLAEQHRQARDALSLTMNREPALQHEEEAMGDDDIEYRFADRFTLQQSWWLAAAIATEHPDLTVSRVQGLDKNQLLLVHDGPTGRRIQFDLFSGAMYEDQEGNTRSVSWLDAFAADDPLSLARRLAQAAGFEEMIDPSGTSRSVVYRLISRILALNLDDEHTWQAVPVPTYGASDGAIQDARNVLRHQFPSAVEAVDEYMDELEAVAAVESDEQQYWHEPLWFLLKNQEPVAVLDEAGYAHVTRGRLNLMDIRDASNCDLGAMAALVLHEPTDTFTLEAVMEDEW